MTNVFVIFEGGPGSGAEPRPGEAASDGQAEGVAAGRGEEFGRAWRMTSFGVTCLTLIEKSADR